MKLQLPWGNHPARAGGKRPGATTERSRLSVDRDAEICKAAAGLRTRSSAGQQERICLRPMKKAQLEVAAEEVAQQAMPWKCGLTNGIDAAMNKFNRRAETSRKTTPEVRLRKKDSRLLRKRSRIRKRNEAIMEERLYDLIFIVRPPTPEDEIKKVVARSNTACTEKGGQDREGETLGNAEALAYKVAKHREGMYYYHQIRTNRRAVA